MTTRAAGAYRRNHVLLIGIDDYVRQPLSGCVNDAVAMRELLISRFHVRRDEITLLAAPDGARPDVPQGTPLPTAAAIREALDRLASDAVTEEDRVIVHYSGHGSYQRISGAGHAHLVECIVPVDFGPRPESYIYDAELNRRVEAIERRTGNVTFVFDCCHSAGVTRSGLFDPRATARGIALDPIVVDDAAGGELRAMLTRRSRGVATARARSLTVAACLADESALEIEDDGKCHGVLTRALLSALATDEAVTWGEIWSTLLGAARPSQNPMLYGDERHEVFGPLVARDRGDVPVSRKGDTYEIGAGTLVDVTPGTRIAIYGDVPDRFDPIDSDADRAARVGELVVTAATEIGATAVASAPFELKPRARARVVSRLAPAIHVDFDPAPSDRTLERLKANTWFASARSGRGDVRVVKRGDTWILCDDAHGLAEEGRVELVRCAERQLVQVLERYVAYRTPLRLAARCNDLRGELAVRVLDARNIPAGTNLQDPDLPEVGSVSGFTYAYPLGEPFCVVVANDSRAQLHATLLNCASSGRVQHLASFVLPGSSAHTLWSGEKLGVPYRFAGKPGVERFVVIASTRPDVDWRFLEREEGFLDGVRFVVGDDDARGDGGAPPLYASCTAMVRVT